MNVLDYYEVVTSKIFKLESMNEGLVLIAPEQEVDGIRSLMVGLYVPEHERYKMYTFRSSMNEGELGDKYKAMVGSMDVLKPDWDRIRKKKVEEDLTSYRLKYRRNILDGYLSEYIKQKCVEISENANYFKIIFRKDENKLEFSCISRRFLLPLRM